VNVGSLKKEKRIYSHLYEKESSSSVLIDAKEGVFRTNACGGKNGSKRKLEVRNQSGPAYPNKREARRLAIAQAKRGPDP